MLGGRLTVKVLEVNPCVAIFNIYTEGTTPRVFIVLWALYWYVPYWY
eukprot:COSAG02_NODE_30883_length_543_cov_1.184685_1_plen_47_part_00